MSKVLELSEDTYERLLVLAQQRQWTVFDTRALAKLSGVEAGSSWVPAVVAQPSGQMIDTAVLTQPEIVRALQRRVRAGTLEAHQAQPLAPQVLDHMPPS